MSIHPEFAEAILAGTKQVEFRKRPIAGDVTHVVVYATAPVSAIVGAFTVRAQETADPETLWLRFAHVAGIGRLGFFDYFADHRDGVGIRVGEVLTLDAPMALAEGAGVCRPPQSFQYLDQPTAKRVLARMRRAHEPIGT